ncbi:MAG: hypothetical protein H0U12_05845 [Thermoleophilaceae bacterium]|nr:hypothetical protein [Thermoleophilaceae bacterium]
MIDARADDEQPQTDRREDDATRPQQHAARNEPGGEQEKTPQDETDDERFDTGEHSDAPGPFGTG